MSLLTFYIAVIDILLWSVFLTAFSAHNYMLLIPSVNFVAALECRCGKMRTFMEQKHFILHEYCRMKAFYNPYFEVLNILNCNYHEYRGYKIMKIFRKTLFKLNVVGEFQSGKCLNNIRFEMIWTMTFVKRRRNV